MEKNQDTSIKFTGEDIVLVPLQDDRQLGHGDTQLVDSQIFRKCSISTKIADVKRCFFEDSRLARRREACIIIFQIEVGRQKQRSHQRLTDLSIGIMFEEDMVDEKDNVPPTAAISTDEAKLVYKATYPRSARGNVSTRKVSKEMKAQISPTAMNISVGGGTLGRLSSKVESYFSEFKCSSAGDMGVQIDLTENAIDKTGVPDLLRFAVLLQTDGLPFGMAITFRGTTPYLGMKIGGELSLDVGQNHLWIRSRHDKGPQYCDDADSDEFVQWIKSKTNNTSWAEVMDYQT